MDFFFFSRKQSAAAGHRTWRRENVKASKDPEGLQNTDRSNLVQFFVRAGVLRYGDLILARNSGIYL